MNHNKSPKPAALAAALLCAAGLVRADEPADLVFTGGRVYTVDARNQVAQAVAVKGGRILFVGADREARRYVGNGTRVVPLGGRMLMPGLVDGHVHPMGGGEGTLRCSLDYKPLKVAQMQDKVRACLADMAGKSDKEWLQVVNWDRQATSASDRDPTQADLDALGGTRPIIVTSVDNHSRLNNGAALAAAGIDASTPNPSGGLIVKDAQGRPTGMLEDGAVLLSDKAIPPASDADRLQFARIALKLFAQQGVTSFLSALSDESEVAVFHQLYKAGELTARAQFAIKVDPKEADEPSRAVAGVLAIAERYSAKTDGEQAAVGVHTIKMWLDGVLAAPAQTAALLTPYFINHGTHQHQDWRAGSVSGQSYYTRAQLDGMLQEAGKAGLDVHIHAIGDATVRNALDAIERERRQHPGRDVRPAIAHAELVDPADYGRFKALDVTAVLSLQWAQRAPYSIEAAQKQLGPQRFARMEPSGALQAAGTRIAYGSDWPVDPLAYFYNLRVGVTRSGDPTHPAGYGPAYAGRLNPDPVLSRAEAIRAITANAAYQLRMEKQVGSIEVGKLADLIVLNRNFMTAPIRQLAHTRTLLTLVGGRVVWADGPFAKLSAAASR